MRHILLGGLLCLTAWVYFPSLRAGVLSWDDESLLAQPAIHASWPRALRMAFTSFDPELYDPFTILSYRLEQSLRGMQPFIMHMDNLLLHLLNVCLVYMLLRRLLRHDEASLLGAAAFALHPLMVEPVAWISGRKDLLCAAFVLSSTLLFLRGTKKAYAMSVLLFLCALFSKVTAAPLPLALLVLGPLPKWRVRLRRVLPFFVLSVTFGIIALFGKVRPLDALTLTQTIGLTLRSLAYALWKLLWPHPLSIVYPAEHAALFSLSHTFAILAIFLTALAVWAMRRSMPLIACGIVWAVLFLLPSTFSFARAWGITLTADRYMYVPGVGLALGVGALFIMLQARLSAFIVRSCALLFLAMYASSSAWRVGDWETSEALYSSALRVYPGNAAMHYNFGLERAKAGDSLQALVEMEATLQLHPSFSGAMANKGFLLGKLGRRIEAIETLRKAIADSPGDAVAHLNLGSIFLDDGRTDEAIKELQAAVHADPSSARAWRTLGAAFGKAERYEEGIQALQNAKTMEEERLLKGGS